MGRRGGAVGYVEVADFHVAVARRADPSLVGRSVLVGGDPQKRGKVLASSADLQGVGIVAGLPLSEAIDRAPDAVWVQTDMKRAREVSGLLRAAIRREIESLEPEGLSGFFMEAPRMRESALSLAQGLESRVSSATGLPLRVGIAPARFAARMVAEDAGSAGVRVIDAEAFDTYLLRQPIERFPGVGPKTAARLAELGASDVRGLRALGLERLEILLGNHGRSLWLLACGEDPRPLRARRHPATLSREHSLSAALSDPAQLDASVAHLAEQLEGTLLREGLCASRIAIRLTFEDTHTLTRSQTLSEAISSAGRLTASARELLDRVGSANDAVRKIALILAGLEIQGAEERQLRLF